MNPAQRILNVVEAIKNEEARGQNCLRAWESIFTNIHPAEPWNEQSITTALLALEDQSIFLQEELRERGLPQQIYLGYLNRFRSVIKPSLLPERWETTQTKIDTASHHILHWISLYLGEEENEISQSDLDELVASLNELEALAAEEGLPRSLRRLIQQNTKQIWEALLTYPIVGSASLQEALNHIAGDFMFHEKELREALNSPDSEVRDASSKLVNLVKGAANTLNSAVKTGESVAKIGSFIGNLPQLPL